MDINELRQLLNKLRHNQTILQEREAKYANQAPLSLLNQLEDYKKAIQLTKDTIIGDITVDDLTEALKPLILDMDNPAPSLEMTPQIPPPPEPVRLPSLQEFVARRLELTYFASKLALDNLAVITGMPGMGKTTLAIMLADFWKMRMSVGLDELHQVGQAFTLTKRFSKTIDQIFWHIFYPDEGIEQIIWHLAGFLAWNGQTELWEMLQGTRQAQGEVPPPAVLLDYLFQMLQKQKFLLCFDDFHFVADDPLLESFVTRLTRAITAKDINLVIISRHLPDFAEHLEFKPLGGLNRNNIAYLLKMRGLALPNTLITELYTQTGGNPQFVILAIEALKQTHNPARLISNLVDSDDIEEFLLEQVDAHLTPEEREVMIGLSILKEYPGSRDAVEAILENSNLRRPLHALSDRYLINVIVEDANRKYCQNKLISAFYYDTLSTTEQQDMHRRAAVFYASSSNEVRPDLVRAARHYYYARDYDQAANLIIENLQTIINQGAAQAVRLLLKRFKENNLLPPLWIALQIAQGRISALFGEGDEALNIYQNALKRANNLKATIDGSTRNQLKVKILHWLAELHYQQGNYRGGLYAIQNGLALLVDQEISTTVDLTLIAAQIYIRQGDYEAALKAGEKGLNIAKKLDNIPTLARAYNVLGRIANLRGVNQLAIGQYKKGLTLYEEVNDLVGKAKSKDLIGRVYFEMGQWSEAKKLYLEARQIFQTLGDTYYCASLNNNLGKIALNQGHLEDALDYYTDGTELLEQNDGSPYLQGIFHAGLGATHIRRGTISAAEHHLAISKAFCEETQTRDFLPKLHRLEAEAALQANRIPEAEERANLSLTLARDLGRRRNEGQTLRILGEIAYTRGQIEEAMTHLTESINLLKKVPDDYEYALSELALAGVYSSQGNQSAGLTALDNCLPIFERLGATFDLLTAKRLKKVLKI